MTCELRLLLLTSTSPWAVPTRSSYILRRSSTDAFFKFSFAGGLASKPPCFRWLPSKDDILCRRPGEGSRRGVTLTGLNPGLSGCEEKEPVRPLGTTGRARELMVGTREDAGQVGFLNAPSSTSDSGVARAAGDSCNKSCCGDSTSFVEIGVAFADEVVEPTGFRRSASAACPARVAESIRASDALHACGLSDVSFSSVLELVGTLRLEIVICEVSNVGA